MKTIVVTGGTSGIGQALANTCLGRGDRVVVVAPDPVKGKKFLDTAQKAGAADRAVFIEADLSLVSENRRVIAEIEQRFAAVDVLVLCARYFRSRRMVTSEGIEHLLRDGWRVRALTRDPHGAQATALARAGAQVVRAQREDVDSLTAEGAWGLFRGRPTVGSPGTAPDFTAEDAVRWGVNVTRPRSPQASGTSSSRRPPKRTGIPKRRFR
ncbi:SDR family NAD(P)-dependent oxidoreductase [Streptomyces lavenduligriseus]|nr:SDR family NAD(P)-dependent oxidoreductase [Streptomyces lavenduligriseus]